MIYPSPLSADHYVVINSGLTAAWADWAGDFPTPRYGDFAIFKVKEGSDDPEAATRASSTSPGNCSSGEQSTGCMGSGRQAAECRR